mgnify:CR=1 FL=1
MNNSDIFFRFGYRFLCVNAYVGASIHLILFFVSNRGKQETWLLNKQVIEVADRMLSGPQWMSWRKMLGSIHWKWSYQQINLFSDNVNYFLISKKEFLSENDFSILEIPYLDTRKYKNLNYRICDIKKSKIFPVYFFFLISKTYFLDVKQ